MNAIKYLALQVVLAAASLLFSYLFVVGVVYAIDGEVKFQENIKKARCDSGKYPVKYCEGL